MTVRALLTYPHPLLRQHSLTVIEPTGNLCQQVIQDLCDTMDHSGHSVGIAAPQIGELQRIIVVDCSQKVKNSLGRLILINPEIIEQEDVYTMREGCMSLPEYVGQVTRHRRITVQALDQQGQMIRVQAKSLRQWFYNMKSIT